MNESRSDIETWPIDRVLNRRILWKKYTENLH